MLDKLPIFNEGWNEVLDVMATGKFFSTTGEILIPSWAVNGAGPGSIAQTKNGLSQIDFELQWTFPLEYAEIISGDGETVFRKRINLDHTTAFGKQLFSEKINLKGKHWVRLEVWDAAVNGAFTQTIWLDEK